MHSNQNLIDYLLLLGDSALIAGQRLCEWCGRAPAIEEELALMNVGLDLVGQARNWLEYAAELQVDSQSADDLAFRRDERAYRNLLLVEQPNGDFAVTMTKQFLYDAWHFHLMEELSNSADARLAGIASKALKEVTYHLRRSSEWVQRMGGGTEESRNRMLAAIPALWRFTVELADGSESEKQLAAAGITADPVKVGTAWQNHVETTFKSVELPVPQAASYFYLSGRQGVHSEHLGLLLAEMQSLPRAYPDATW